MMNIADNSVTQNMREVMKKRNLRKYFNAQPSQVSHKAALITPACCGKITATKISAATLYCAALMCLRSISDLYMLYVCG